MNNLYPAATRSIIQRLHGDDFSTIQSIHYRAGKYPGSFTVTDTRGAMKRLSKFAFNYLSLCYMFPRCLTCYDQTSELADVSFGDAWKENPVMDDTGEGRTVVVTRSEAGDTCISEAMASGAITAQPVSLQEAHRMHAHVLDYKKNGTAARIKLMKLFGRATPYYRCMQPTTRISQLMRAMIILTIVRLGRTSYIRWMVKKIPISWIEYTMKNMRTLWRSHTHLS
ncbi:MAG: hypothetical protein GF384_03420 [Elusimicrobia bacterium]|nr:hypothetical protein [Elusimicrobiota bacterium]